MRQHDFHRKKTLTYTHSYPRWGKARNTVTLVGRNKEYMDSLVPEVEKGVQGKRVTKEGEDDVDGESDKDT
jgi:hypothetical protein